MNLPSRLAAIAILVVLTACSSVPARNPLAQWVPSSNEEARRPVIIVIHATEQDSVERSLNTLRTTNSGGRVSAHYLIGRDGSLYQLVADERRAWHAGAGRWGTMTDLNSTSIGIELDNDGGAEFPDEQMATLIRLLDDLCTRLGIAPSQVIAHYDMAPTRKRDPNVLFPWKALAEAGFGIWPAADAAPAPAEFDPWMGLALLGYPMTDPAAALRAFHRRFRQLEGDFPMDEEDARLIYSLTKPLRRTETE